VIIALGANDGLRGLPLGQLRDNLKAMIQAALDSGAKVLLAGIRLPPNYGPYAVDFHATFKSLAAQYPIAWLDFLLEPIAAHTHFFQADNLHPTAEAQPLIHKHLWPALMPLLK
jgi:acyl-CoA thioesterase-1